MGGKSAEAFRTISEVADLIGTPAHVLRFWETKFSQIKPVKRAGGRRYYRPGDVALIDGIRRLLHDDGMTIRGVQKILREKGQRHVSGLSRFAEGIEGAESNAAPPEPAAGPRNPAAEVAQMPEPAPKAPQAAPPAALPLSDRPDAQPVEAPPPEPAEGDEGPTRHDDAAMAPGPVLPEPPPEPAPAPAPAPSRAAAPKKATRPPEPETPELPFGDLPRAEKPRPGARPAPNPADLPVSSLLRRMRPEAANRADLAEIEKRLVALRDRLAASAPGPRG